MTERRGSLTTKDHDKMDAFCGQVLEDFHNGVITKKQAIGALAHVMTALDTGNTGEAVSWFENAQEFIRETR